MLTSTRGYDPRLPGHHIVDPTTLIAEPQEKLVYDMRIAQRPHQITP